MFVYTKPEQKKRSKDTVQKKEAKDFSSLPNLTGIPDEMKTQFENSSGLSFDDVRVHYNSDKPVQLRALAYTQGNRVFVGPGQEKHLGHELGHVLQQKRGQVIPTRWEGGYPINDEQLLERKADCPVTANTKNPGAALISDTVQRKSIFDDIDPKSPNFINDLLRLMGMEGSDVLDQHMDLMKNDGNAANLGKGTIRQYITKLLGNLSGIDKDASVAKAMKISEVVKGVARGLATRTGDLSATNRIARNLMRDLQLVEDEQNNTEDEPQGISNLFQYVDSFGRSNPILKYLHREINAQDAAVLVQRRANRAGMLFDEMFSLLQKEAFAEIKSLDDNMFAGDPANFKISNTPGLYSKSFRDKVFKSRLFIGPAWSADALSSINKIKLHENTNVGFRPTVKDGEPYAVTKAKRHDTKMEAHGEYGTLRAVVNSIDPAYVLDPVTFVTFVNSMVERLSQSDITITRHASNLLARELSEGDVPHSLRPGTSIAYMTLDEMKLAPNLNINSELPQGSGEKGAAKLSFIPLLPNNQEKAVRNQTYPLFRSYKDNLYKGKPWLKGGSRQIFGALNFAADSNNYGYAKGGMKEGLYGDVTLVLADSVKTSGKVLYTNKADGKSYTSPEKFVYALLKDKTNIYHEPSLDTPVLDALCKAAMNKPVDANALHLEVQIFSDIQLDNRNIKKVVFASSVKEEDRDLIKTRMQAGSTGGGLGGGSGLGAVAPPPTKFYQYKAPNVDTLVHSIFARVKSYNINPCLRSATTDYQVEQMFSDNGGFRFAPWCNSQQEKDGIWGILKENKGEKVPSDGMDTISENVVRNVVITTNGFLDSFNRLVISKAKAETLVQLKEQYIWDPTSDIDTRINGYYDSAMTNGKNAYKALVTCPELI